jgi:hypothetical protein
MALKGTGRRVSKTRYWILLLLMILKGREEVHFLVTICLWSSCTPPPPFLRMRVLASSCIEANN